MHVQGYYNTFALFADLPGCLNFLFILIQTCETVVHSHEPATAIDRQSGPGLLT
jgi:hypothetical protein